MRLLIDSFWRAVAYCLHPRVVLLSVLPVLLMAGSALGLAYLYWDVTVHAVRAWLEGWSLVQSMLTWLESVGAGQLRSVFAPLLVLALVTPVLVVLALLMVGLFMTPAMVSLVAQRRFPQVERQGQVSAPAQVGTLDAATLWPQGSDADFYLCGPVGFLQVQLRALQQLGVPAARIHTEVFDTGGVQA